MSGRSPAKHAGWKGNKAALPSKPCVACGRAMSWRRGWAKNWPEVRYCCEACRRTGPRHATAPPGAERG